MGGPPSNPRTEGTISGQQICNFVVGRAWFEAIYLPTTANSTLCKGHITDAFNSTVWYPMLRDVRNYYKRDLRFRVMQGILKQPFIYHLLGPNARSY